MRDIRAHAQNSDLCDMKSKKKKKVVCVTEVSKLWSV